MKTVQQQPPPHSLWPTTAERVAERCGGCGWEKVKDNKFLVVLPSTSSTLERRRRHETVIILDWDDTLLPSSWVANKHNLSSPTALAESAANMSDEESAALESISEAGCRLLRQCHSAGRVVIVTNAGDGWVELSASLLLPAVLQLVRLLRIPVLSARAAFESAERQHPAEWKYETFARVLEAAAQASFEQADHEWAAAVMAAVPSRNRYRGTRKSLVTLISLGDSDAERVAAKKCVAHLRATGALSLRCKSCKLCERPSLGLMKAQLHLVTAMLPQLLMTPGDLDLKVKFRLTTNASSVC